MSGHLRRPAAPETTPKAVKPDKEDPKKSNQDVLLYMTLNNTTHRHDELPETLAALDKAEQEGLGQRSLLPISDPYAEKGKDGKLTFSDATDKYSMGEEGAERIQWWHGQEDLKAGQVRVNGEILQLGTDKIDVDKPEQTQEVMDSWRKTLAAGGMDEKAINKSVEALFKDKKGNFRKLGSGDGATNELAQYMMAMHRSEKGEIDISSVVLSGHHWEANNEHTGDEESDRSGGHGIWGEIPGSTNHAYDNDSDFFSLVDMAELKDAFPKAYGKVKSVQLAACNTDALGIKKDGESDETYSTNEFLQENFQNIQMASYTKKALAPLANKGFAANGEFALDSMRLENGDKEAAKDVRNKYKGLVRSTLNEDGKLEEFKPKQNKKSYGGSKKKGLKGKNKTSFDERTDLADHLYTAPTLPETKLTPKGT